MKILALLKFGEKDHLMDLYQNGKLFCNSIEYFKKIEDGQLRGDSFEGSLNLKRYPKGSTIEFRLQNGSIIKSNTAKFTYREHLSNIKGNIYSLTAVTADNIDKMNQFHLDQRVKEFGSFALFISNPREFIEKVERAFQSQNKKLFYSLVEYYDPEQFEGEIGFFRKPNIYKYQNEFRFLIENETEEPLNIYIDPIDSFSDIIDLENAKSII